VRRLGAMQLLEGFRKQHAVAAHLLLLVAVAAAVAVLSLLRLVAAREGRPLRVPAVPQVVLRRARLRAAGPARSLFPVVLAEERQLRYFTPT
jgi:hypothetical protein